MSVKACDNLFKLIERYHPEAINQKHALIKHPKGCWRPLCKWVGFGPQLVGMRSSANPKFASEMT